MATLAESLKTSSGRPLLLRKRPDLVARKQRYQGLNYWVVKEPVGLKYFRFQEEEYAILEMLDGRTSFDQVQHRFQEQFAPQKILLGDLQQFVGMLHRSGLVISTAARQGRQLKVRRDERRRKERWAKLSNILAIRFKGIDPDWLLSRGYSCVAWFFSPVTVIFCCLMALAAVALIVVQFDVFQSKLPAFYEFFGPSNWLWLGLVLAGTKVLHEFGHGFSCKHFGGECHEIGVMILVLTPCLYCNVSDSWMLPSKWKRAAIGAAGMYVELMLATIATFIWWFSAHGILNHLCLRIMFICSVSTILFNGNPLLRFDGYYILSDIVEIPNLRQKSSSILNRMMARWCLGMELPEEPFLPQRNQIFFALYTLAAVAYRWMVLISILYFLYKVFEPYGLQIIGQAMAFMAISGLVVKPIWQLIKFLGVPGRIHQVKRLNFVVTMSVALAIVLAVLWIPVPHRVTCPLEVLASDAVPVYIEVPGRLSTVYVRPGQKVKRGDLLAELQNIDLRMDVAKLQGEREATSAQLVSLRHLRHDDPRAHSEVGPVKETLTAINEQLEEKVTDLERLSLLAPVAGTILPPAQRSDNSQQEGRLPRWTGLLMDPRNLGATVVASEPFCEIGNRGQLEAVLVIDQSERQMVRIGQRVKIKLDGYPGTTLWGKVGEIAEADSKTAPRSLSSQAGGGLATRTDASGATVPQSTSYRARVPMTNLVGSVWLHARGRGKVYTGWRPLGERIWRFLNHTFHFTL